MVYINSNSGVGNSAMNHAGSWAAQHQVFETIRGSGATRLDDVCCQKDLSCSGSTMIKDSRLNTMRVSGETELRNSTAGDISASGNFYASDCPKLGDVKTSGHAAFVNCGDVQGVVASGFLSLLGTRVEGDVRHSGRELQINQSTINGKLECSDRKIALTDSSVQAIIVKPCNSSSYSYSLEFFGIKLSKQQVASSSEYLVELVGKNCIVGSVSFEEGINGRVVLKNEARVTGQVSGGVLDSHSPKSH